MPTKRDRQKKRQSNFLKKHGWWAIPSFVIFVVVIAFIAGGAGDQSSSEVFGYPKVTIPVGSITVESIDVGQRNCHSWALSLSGYQQFTNNLWLEWPEMLRVLEQDFIPTVIEFNWQPNRFNFEDEGGVSAFLMLLSTEMQSHYQVGNLLTVEVETPAGDVETVHTSFVLDSIGNTSNDNGTQVETFNTPFSNIMYNYMREGNTILSVTSWTRK